MYRQEQTLGDQFCDGLQGNEPHNAASHAPPPRAPTLVTYNTSKRRLLSE
jgi:hypothetical protein